MSSSALWTSPRGLKDLTEREVQVLTGVVDGLDNASIGKRLFLAEDTVKTHLRRLYRKLGVANRVEAVMEGMKQQVIPCACQRSIDKEVLEAARQAADQKERDVLAHNNRAPGSTALPHL